jgi:transposase
MRFVPVKSEEQQGMLMIHRSRDLLVRQRTATVNALRGHLAEFGITAAKGTARARELMSLVDTDDRVPAIARHPSATCRPNSRYRAQDRGFRQADLVARAGERGLPPIDDGTPVLVEDIEKNELLDAANGGTSGHGQSLECCAAGID